MPPWTIRTATLDDIPALRALITVSARGLNTDAYTPEQVESILKYVYGVDTQLIHDQTYFVIETDETLIGCGGWSKRDTLYGGDQAKVAEPDNLLNPATDSARIRAFFVHPDWARKGIGSALMTACEDAARQAGFRAMALMATLTGEHLYTRFGFTAIADADVPLPDSTVVRFRRMTKALA